jgi:hypothetical protein
VAPLTLLVGALGDWAAEVADLLVITVVVPSVVTAMHVSAVQDLGRGERPSIVRSVTVAARVAGPVALVVVLYTLGVAAGFVALIAPGIFLAVHWYFGAQSAVVDGTRGPEALKASGRLVSWMWGRAFVLLIVFGALTAALTAASRAAVMGLVDDGALAVTVLDCAVLSYTALISTLLFFDLRARTEQDEGPMG